MENVYVLEEKNLEMENIKMFQFNINEEELLMEDVYLKMENKL